jgi:hypothetical protein
MALQPCMAILPPPQQRVWPLLKPAVELEFVLYGGTAIALRLGHRRSVDFDFFSATHLDKSLLLQHMPWLIQAIVVQDERDSLTFLVSDPQNSEPVKISFFGGVDFGRVGEPDLTEDGVLRVASLADLMATKVKVILQRAESKDYKDIAAMLRAGMDLATGLAAAKIFFGPNFQPSESLRALVFYEDGDLAELDPDDKRILVNAVSQVRDLPEVCIRSKHVA